VANNLTYKFEVKKECSLRFLSNNFFVRVYEIVQEGENYKFNNCNYDGSTNIDVITLYPGAQYCLSFLPYASFTKLDVGERVVGESGSFVDANDITRPIDLFIQKLESGTWYDLISETDFLEFFTPNKESEFITDGVIKIADFIATPKKTAGIVDPNSSGFEYNTDYQFERANSQPYIYLSKISTKVAGYQLISSIGKEAFNNCYKLYNVSDPGKVLDSLDASLITDSCILNNQKPDIELSPIGDFIYFTHPVSFDLDYSGRRELLAYLNSNDIISKLHIDDSINIISAYTFVNRDEFTKDNLILPNSLERIETKAFYDCDKLDKDALNISINVKVAEDAFDFEM
jgi:hypothetical protein